MSKFRIRTGTKTVEDSSGALGAALNTWFEQWGPDAIFKSCANCRHMVGGNAPAFCQKYKMTPPASVITVGCPAHDDAEEIPF